MMWFTGLLGTALILAPFIFGYNTDPSALWSSLIFGVVIVAASTYETFARNRMEWAYWVGGIVGVVVMAIPFVLGFSTFAAAMWVSIAIGALVAMVDGFQIYTIRAEA